MNVLFVCSRNQWRSPTAEKLFAGRPGIQTKSAGTEPSARIRVTEKLVHWADLILVTEKRHKERLREKFGSALSGKRVEVLDIEDDYTYMDPDLITVLHECVPPIVERYV